MYQLTLTVRQYPLHTVINGTLEDVSETGTRTHVNLSHDYLPMPSGGLFESDKEHFLYWVLGNFDSLFGGWVDTHQ